MSQSNLPAFPHYALLYSYDTPLPHWKVVGSQFYSPPLPYTLLATTDPPPSPPGNHVIPKILQPPPPLGEIMTVT